MDQNSPTPGTPVSPSTPATSSSTGSVIGDLLRTLGVGHAQATEVHEQAQSGNVHTQIDQAHKYITEALNHAREQAQKNPAAVLGGLSALVIAAGMLRNHSSGR
ncbi:MAG: hypothetical protein ABI837_06370 [Acidobacteriota bacterium]